MRDDEHRILLKVVPGFFWRHVSIREWDACWPWTKATIKGGYGRYTPFRDGRWLAHRVAWTLANEMQIPRGFWLLHSCDNPRCCNPRHLSIGTAADNSGDMVSKGRQMKGEAQVHAALKEEDVRYIRASSETQVALAKRFGVWQTTISAVIRRKTWKHL